MKVRTIAAILQQSEYDFHYFISWYKRHKNSTIEINPEKITFKLKVIDALLIILSFLPILFRVELVLNIVSLGENTVRYIIYFLAKIKLWYFKQKGLKVVAIAGSFGKTSTKLLIDQLLSNQISLLSTPHSVNTPLGISLVILKVLQPKHKLFVVELGEYYRGDIAKLARFIRPDWGIMTPIGRQHLERMKDLSTIAATIGELNDYFTNSELILSHEVNLELLPDYKGDTYGKSKKSAYYIDQELVSRSGTEFKVYLPNQEYQAFAPFYGVHQAINLLPSFWLSDKLKLDQQKIIKDCAKIKPLPRRHEPTFLHNDILLLDNSYNTNPDSIKSSLKLFSDLGASHKILITMGFVELGAESQQIHFELGQQLAKEIDYLGLLEAPQTGWILEGWKSKGGNENSIVIGKSAEEILQKLQFALIPKSIIILEGGYKELYN